MLEEEKTKRILRNFRAFLIMHRFPHEELVRTVVAHAANEADDENLYFCDALEKNINSYTKIISSAKI